MAVGKYCGNVLDNAVCLETAALGELLILRKFSFLYERMESAKQQNEEEEEQNL